MLNKNGERELAYVARIEDVKPISNYDRVEYARIGAGWWVIVKKDEFKVGDLCIYFEVDSKVPETEPFMFLESRHFKVKTLKMCKVISQGLIIHPSAFNFNRELVEGEFLTKELGITYAEAEDNERKGKGPDKYAKMAQRHPSIFKKKWARWLMKREWGRKLMFRFFGKKKDKATGFPTHFPYIKKTDQERVENMGWILNDKTPLIKTQKCDGSSGTFILERKGKNKFEFYVCSRNVRQLKPEQKCFYEENYYWEVAIKYNLENILKDILIKNPSWEYCALQGEICSPNIQKNPHGLTETHFFAFHFIDSEKGKWDIRDMKKICDEYNIPSVPITDENYILPDDFEELKKDAIYYYSPDCCEGKTKQLAEGWVYYKTTDPNFSFKNVSREYLLKNS